MYNYYDTGIDTMDILSGMLDSLSTFIKAAAFFIFIIGAIQCFMGYKWLKFVLAVSGFMTGSVIGAIIGILGGLNGSNEISEVVSTIMFVMLIFGIIGAVIAYRVYKFGVFLIGFAGIYIISLLINLAERIISGSDNIMPAFVMALIPAIIAGCLMVKFTKPLIIIYTALSGAYTASFALSTLMGGGGFFIMIVLSVAGIYVQCKTNDGLTEKKRSDNKSTTPPLKYDYLKNNTENQSAFHYDYSRNSSDSGRKSSLPNLPPKNDDDIPKIID